MKELIVASRNQGKVREIKELLADLPFKVTSLLEYPHIPEIIEDGKTYHANALKKADQRDAQERRDGEQQPADDVMEAVHG